MRTTLVLNEKLINEAKTLSGSRTKKEVVEKALEEFVKKRKSRKLVNLEGRFELSYTLEDLLSKRKKDVPYR